MSKKRRTPHPKPRTVELVKSTYQPTKAELEQANEPNNPLINTAKTPNQVHF